MLKSYSNKKMSSWVDGDEQLDRPNSQTTMCCIIIVGFNIHTTAFCFGRSSLHLLLLKSLWPMPMAIAKCIRLLLQSFFGSSERKNVALKRPCKRSVNCPLETVTVVSLYKAAISYIFFHEIWHTRFLFSFKFASKMASMASSSMTSAFDTKFKCKIIQQKSHSRRTIFENWNSTEGYIVW